MGRHRYAGRTRKHLNPFRADSALAATLPRIFGPDWFLTGRAFVFLGPESGEQIRRNCFGQQVNAAGRYRVRQEPAVSRFCPRRRSRTLMKPNKVIH